MSTRRLTIDLVTLTPDGTYRIVIVEEGPWNPEEVDAQLHRIQDRLYDCVDCAVDGHFASLYPESRGKAVIISLDCYDVPDSLVAGFFARFTEHVRSDSAIQRDISDKKFIASLDLEYKWATLAESR